jgi:hypothetical protein
MKFKGKKIERDMKLILRNCKMPVVVEILDEDFIWTILTQNPPMSLSYYKDGSYEGEAQDRDYDLQGVIG